MVNIYKWIQLFFLSICCVAFGGEVGNTNEESLLKEAKALNSEQRYSEAITIYEKLLEHSPKNTDYYFLLGKTYLQMESFETAIDTYAEGLKIQPNNAELKVAMGYAYLQRGIHFPRLWPQYQWFWYPPYVFYLTREEVYPRPNWNDISISQSIFEGVLAQNPQDSDALTGIGRIEALKDNKVQAECYYAEALHIRPNNDTTFAYYAALLSTNGEYYSSRNMYEKYLELDPADAGTRKDYIDVVKRSNPEVNFAGFYAQENEQDPISTTQRAWTARLYNYGGLVAASYAPFDRLKVAGSFIDEYIRLKNLIGKTYIYSLSVQRGNLGFVWNATPYASVSGALGATYYAKYKSSTTSIRSGYYIQPALNITYTRNHQSTFIETNSDTILVARDPISNRSTLIDRQFLRGFYEYNFGNRTQVGVTAANIWYINRIKWNQQQIGTTWIQWGPPRLWQYITFRYQFIYGRFNKLTPDYYVYRFQTTHWLNVTLSKNWFNDKLITEAGYGHAWQRGFETGQILTTTPTPTFHILYREINAAFARLEFDPNDSISMSLTGTYTLDTFNYTTASVTGKFQWNF